MTRPFTGAFDPGAFAADGQPILVFDNPQVGARLDFDAVSALGGAGLSLAATRGDITVTGFASVGLTSGFVGQASRAEVSVTGNTGGLVLPLSLNAQTGSVSVQGGWPGTQGKAGGLLENASDPDGDPLSFQIMSLPLFGTLQVEFNGAFLYNPNRGFSGTDSFTWRPWANGEAGNIVTVTLLVEEQRQALFGEVNVTGFAGAMAGSGLNSPAILGEISVTGFVSAGLLAAFVGTAIRADVDVVGMAATLEGSLQALRGEVAVQGFAGVLTAASSYQATRGEVAVQGLTPLVSIGFVTPATLGEVEVEGFFSSNVEYIQQPTLAEVSVAGFASHYLELPLRATFGQVTVTGFGGRFNNVIILPPPEPERPADIVYYDPRNHLPAGRILDHEMEDELMAYWASVSYRVLTDLEMNMLVGTPLATPVIRREFGTGHYPSRKTGTY